MIAEMLMRLRRWSPAGVLVEPGSGLGYGAVDLLCVNKSGANLTGQTADPGSDWVEFDWSKFTRGELPAVVALGSAGIPLGCCHWTSGVVPNNGQIWVRIFGWHPYAAILGNASLAVGSPLIQSSSGIMTYTASQAIRTQTSLVAYTTAAVAAKDAWISNPSKVPT